MSSRARFPFSWMSARYVLTSWIDVPVGQRERALNPMQASWTVARSQRETIGRMALIDLLEEAGISIWRWSSVGDHEIAIMVKRQIESRRLLVFPENVSNGRFTERRQEPSKEALIVRGFMENASHIAWEGQRLELFQAVAWTRTSKLRHLQVVPLDQATPLLKRLAAAPATSALRKKAIGDALPLLLGRITPASTAGLVLVRRVVARSFSTADAVAPLTPSQIAKPFAKPEARQWIRVQVVDDKTGRPLPDLLVVLTSAEGTKSRLTTDSQGLAKLENVVPSTYALSSPLGTGTTAKTTLGFVSLSSASSVGTAKDTEKKPQPQPIRQPKFEAIALVERYKVKDGDTLDAVAQAYDLDASRLARFNWGSDDPDAVAKALRDEVGCSKATADGKSFELQSSDKPGILFVPQPWQAEGLACKETHVVRVDTGARFFLSLENELGLRIPEAAYSATLANGVEISGTLGVGGVDAIESPPPGPVIVAYPDAYDIGAKSLAARARKSFTDRDPQALYAVLGHSPDTMAAVVAAYGQYFNNHTGDGFVEDVYAEITDPNALAAVEVLMARAGLPTRQPLAIAPADGLVPQPEAG